MSVVACPAAELIVALPGLAPVFHALLMREALVLGTGLLKIEARA